MRLISAFALTLLLIQPVFSQENLTPAELLNRSIAFHDPDGQWTDCRFTLIVDMDIPGRPIRSSKVVINNEKGTFELGVLQNNHLLQWMVDGEDSTQVMVDFREPSPEQADSLSLTADRARRWRDYYGYLYGLPMKLKDQGVNIDEAVISTTFQDKPVLALKVTYDATVGADTWYFYFNPNTYAMTGYRFYHDEAKNDGEYIVLSGMSIKNGMRIPKDRAWYTNAEDKLLGTDYLISMDVFRYWD